MLQSKTLQTATAKIAKSIYPNLLPKNLLFVLSERLPTKGSETPSQSDDIAMAIPTKEPEIPMTLVEKNIMKELSVCDNELYPKTPKP